MSYAKYALLRNIQNQDLFAQVESYTDNSMIHVFSCETLSENNTNLKSIIPFTSVLSVSYGKKIHLSQIVDSEVVSDMINSEWDLIIPKGQAIDIDAEDIGYNL